MTPLPIRIAIYALVSFKRRQEEKSVALYHLSVKTISRSNGRSAVAASAYRSGSKLHDKRTGETADYTRKSGVEHVEIIAPESAPAWAHNREHLWNGAEAAEKRKNSVTAREYEIALPAELTPLQRQEAARAFADWLVERFGVVADVAIHAPGKEGDQRNHHAHILTTTRAVGPEGMGAKTRELDDRQSGAVEEVRAKWAEIANSALERARVAERVDHRSYNRQGIEDAPTAHLGPSAAAMERRGVQTERGNINRLVAAANQALHFARQVMQKTAVKAKEAVNGLARLKAAGEALAQEKMKTERLREAGLKLQREKEIGNTKAPRVPKKEQDPGFGMGF